MRVLIDYAHADLWESLVILFEDRMGWELYRPIGMEWFAEGIWNFERQRLGDQVAQQFLAHWPSDVFVSGHSLRDDTTHPGRTMKLVTLEQARSQPWDVVIATLAENELGLRKFADEVGAVFGIQIGNQGAPNEFGAAAFVLSSVTLPQVPNLWMPHVFYHQEFSLQDFRFDEVSCTIPLEAGGRPWVTTRVQCFTNTQDYPRFRRLARAMPDTDWRHYGHCGEHDDLWGGDTPTTSEIAALMRRSWVGYHVKRWSDGYGHVLHNWFAVGRPLLASSGYYTGRDDGVVKLAAPLFEDGVTSFDVDTRSDAEIGDLVKRLVSDDDYWYEIASAARRRFDAVVDFDAEAAEIAAMFAQVLP